MHVEFWDWPVAVPTVTFRAERSILTIRASAEKYISVAPESMMPLACGCWLLCRLYVLCRLDVRVGIKLALYFKSLLLEVLKLCFKSSLLDVLKLSMPSVPHRHKALLQSGGPLSLFLISSKQY